MQPNMALSWGKFFSFRPMEGHQLQEVIGTYFGQFGDMRYYRCFENRYSSLPCVKFKSSRTHGVTSKMFIM